MSSNSDTFDLEEYNSAQYQINIIYYPDYLYTSQDTFIIKCCLECQTNTAPENLFMVFDLRVVCNLCLPAVIQECKAEKQLRELQRKGLI